MSDRPSKTHIAETSTDTASAERLKGSLKEAIGKLTGNARVEAEGKAQKEFPKSDVKPGTTTS